MLFGAFDRHNFGDLLFPHIAAALLRHDRMLFAGLAERDLRGVGGHHVRAITDFVGQRAHILHVGGELLTCDAWQAAVMLLPPEQAGNTVAHLDARPEERRQWSQRMLRTQALAPYVLSKETFPDALSITCHAMGGVELDACDPALRAEVLAKLRAADDVSVRDMRTQALLDAAGIAAPLVPDPAVMVAELFGDRIRARMEGPGLARVRATFPQGYVAVQFSADFGDDTTLNRLAVQLDRVVLTTGHGIVFFRAGAAPWHDDADCYRRVIARMRPGSGTLCESLDLWDICALIAGSRAYCGSSLHGRIVAMAFALPRVNLCHPAQAGKDTKQSAFALTWDLPDMPAMVDVDAAAQGIASALASDLDQRESLARTLARRYRAAFESSRARLE